MKFTTGVIAGLDQLAGDIVRARERCEYPDCNSYEVQWAHIRRRGKGMLNTRWDTDNALALCITHHGWADAATANMEWLVDHLHGEGKYQELRERSNQPITREPAEIRAALRLEAKALGI